MKQVVTDWEGEKIRMEYIRMEKERQNSDVRMRVSRVNLERHGVQGMKLPGTVGQT